MVANELVDLLQALGKITGISDSVLGLTVLAWGNSIADLLANVSISKEGYPTMAIAGCFAGPTFNVLVGLGLSFTFATWSGDAMDMGNAFQQPLVVCTLVFLIVGLVSTLILVPYNGFHVTKGHGYYLMSLYVAFLAAGLTLVCYF